MKTACFDCFSGASGDMIVAALIDAGASLDDLREGLSSLTLEAYTIDAVKVRKDGFAATQFRVDVDEKQQPHRHLKDILVILDGSSLSIEVKARAAAIFMRLALAEARVHGCDVEDVHFHEVGAVDSIVDVVAASAALEQLEITRVVCTPMAVGSGVVRTAHGELPVPAPATAALLTGVPLAPCDEIGELTTPTGAAVLTEVAESFGPVPAMRMEAVGYGAGQRSGKQRPNVLRVILGSPVEPDEADQIVLLEASVDDATGEMLGYCTERLLEAGALEAYCMPIFMKKSRPGSLVTVLASPQDADRLEAILFAETTTFGVRRHTVRRSKLVREHRTVETSFGPVRVKVGRRGDQVATASPEYEDCRRIAKERGVSLKDVMRAARAAWERMHG